MESITLRSHVGPDGELHLDIPTELANTELDIIVWLQPVAPIVGDKQETFSEWWANQLAITPLKHEHYPERDLRFDYLKERYGL